MARGLDHLVLASHDLDAQADLYRRLGFLVGTRNRHPWGTLNHIVQFSGCFLELIGTEPGFKRPGAGEAVSQFAGFLADYLDAREGFAMVVLESNDAARDQADFAAHGIAGPETMFFERRGRRPDGTDVHVAFTLAFARTPLVANAGFFTCQQHFPECFWNPAYQIHANTVTGVGAAVLCAEDPARLVPFLSAYTGVATPRALAGGWAFDTPRGRIEVLTPASALQTLGVTATPALGPHLVAARFTSADIGQARTRIAESGVAYREDQGRIVVPQEAAHGVTLVFESGDEHR